jgi:hypothetical protein
MSRLIALLALAAVLAALWLTWRDCTQAGGTTVRGVLWLECVQP